MKSVFIVLTKPKAKSTMNMIRGTTAIALKQQLYTIMEQNITVM